MQSYSREGMKEKTAVVEERLKPAEEERGKKKKGRTRSSKVKRVVRETEIYK